MIKPTPAEIVAFAVENGMHVRTGRGAVKFARAVLAKWGTPAAQGDAEDAARYRWLRRKFCLTGNGDGTCSMHAINLPASIKGWPEPIEAEIMNFCDAAIDAARSQAKPAVQHLPSDDTEGGAL